MRLLTAIFLCGLATFSSADVCVNKATNELTAKAREEVQAATEELMAAIRQEGLEETPLFKKFFKSFSSDVETFIGKIEKRSATINRQNHPNAQKENMADLNKALIFFGKNGARYCNEVGNANARTAVMKYVAAVNTQFIQKITGLPEQYSRCFECVTRFTKEHIEKARATIKEAADELKTKMQQLGLDETPLFKNYFKAISSDIEVFIGKIEKRSRTVTRSNYAKADKENQSDLDKGLVFFSKKGWAYSDALGYGEASSAVMRFHSVLSTHMIQMITEVFPKEYDRCFTQEEK